MLRPLVLAAILVALVLAAPAAAHVTPTSSFITADATTSLRLSGPNERGEPMTGFAVTVPAGLRIVQARPLGAWSSEVDGRTATWSGGSLAPEAEATFTLQLEASVEPGTLELEAEQLYPGRAVVRWPITLTVIPGGSVSERGWVDDTLTPPLLLLALLGTAALGLILFLVRKRRRSLQEK